MHTSRLLSILLHNVSRSVQPGLFKALARPGDKMVMYLVPPTLHESSVRAISVTDKPRGVDFGHVTGIFRTADNLAVFTCSANPPSAARCPTSLCSQLVVSS